MMRRAAGLAAVLAVVVSPCLLAQERRASETDVERGVRQVEEGDFESAIKTLERALPGLSADRHAQERSRAYLYMAYAYLYLSQEARAKARFIEALKQDRTINLSPSEFPPKVIQVFEEARAEAGLPAAPPPGPVETGVSPRKAVFLLAVRSGDFAAVSQLLKEEPGLIGVRDNEYGATPLHWAAAKGNEVLVAYLLAEGADATAKNERGQTALEVAELARGQAPRAERAAFDGVIKAIRQASERAFLAVEQGDLATVKRLIESDGSLLGKRDARYGATLLHFAAARGDEPIASLLLSKGADRSALNKAGQTPLQVGEAARARAGNDAERARIDRVIRLLSASASVGRTAPPPASRATPAVASAPAPAPLATRRPPAASPADRGSDDLLIAARSGDVEAARRALAKDPGLLNRPDPEYGATPLHWAALKGHADMVSFLLTAGADTKALNNAGETPLQVAERANRPETLAVLLAER